MQETIQLLIKKDKHYAMLILQELHKSCLCRSNNFVYIGFLFTVDISQANSIPFICETQGTNNEVGREAEWNILWNRMTNVWLTCISMKVQSKYLNLSASTISSLLTKRLQGDMKAILYKQFPN